MGDAYEGRGAAARAKAEKLLEFADNCDKGDEGERETGRLLANLPKLWVVLHNVVVPGHRFDIDHVLIGPGGVIALDSKNYSGAVTVRNGTMRSGGYRRANELAAARDHAACLAETLGETATAALCIHTAQLPADEFRVDGVDVVAPHRLVSWLRDRPHVLLDVQIVALAAAAQRKLEVRGLPESATADDLAGSGSARPPTPPPVPPLATPPGRGPSNPGRRPRAKQSARSRRVEKLITGALTSFAVLGLAAWWLPRQVQRMQHPATPTTTAASSTGEAAPVLKAGTFSCPARGAGWMLSVPWPDRASAPNQAQWSTSPDGPWSSMNWQRGTPLLIHGLPGGGRVFIRAKVSGASAESPESMTMQKTPSTAC